MEGGTGVLKVEPAAEAEGCAVCGGGGGGEELRSVDEHEPAAPGLPPLRTVLLHLAHNKPLGAGRVCGSCVSRAVDAYQFSSSLGRAEPLSDKIRALRRRLHDLTQKIDVFIVVGGGQEGGTYSEEDIIMVDRAALAAAAAADDDELERAHNARGDHVYQCSVCPQSFQRLAEFRAHCAAHPAGARHSCWTCGSQFESRSALHQHARDHHAPAHLCNLCNTTFQSQSELRRHEPSCAAWCPVSACELLCTDRAALAAHVTSHHGPAADPPHVCPVCFAQFNEGSLLSAHALRHRLSRAFVCGHDGCILRFAARAALLAHIRKCHADTTPGTPGAPGTPGTPAPGDQAEQDQDNEQPQVQCEHCYRTFGSVAAMRRHMKVHRGERAGEGAGEEAVEYLEVEALEEMELEYKPDLAQL